MYEEEEAGSSLQMAATACVAFLCLLSLSGNFLVAVWRVLKSPQSPLTAFDILVLNLLVVNFYLSLFIYPYDVVAYIIRDRDWPFSTFYCHFSTFFTSFLPVMGSWSVVGMALHQLFAYVGCVLGLTMLICVRQPNLRHAVTFVPVLIIWLLGVGVHSPIAYNLWNVTVGPQLCTLEGDDGILHDSMWYFWRPFGLVILALIVVGVVRLLSGIPLPRGVHLPSAEPTVAWIQPANDQPEYESRNIQEYSTLLNAHEIPSMILDEPGTPGINWNATPANPASPTDGAVQVSSELHFDHIMITITLGLTLLVCIAPYAIFLLLFHFQDRLEFNLHLAYWDAGFTLMCCKPLVEPFLLMALFPKFRPPTGFWINSFNLIKSACCCSCANMGDWNPSRSRTS